MSQADLALRTNLSTKHINQIVQGVAPVTHETAATLERVTGTPARIWNALEAAYRDSLLRSRRAPLSPADATWLKSLPLAELQGRGYLPPHASRSELMGAVLAFFGVADRLAWERIWLRPAASFRRSQAFQSHPAATAAWLRIGELEGRQVRCAPFDARRFREALLAARAMTRAKSFSDALVAECAKSGVAVVFVREITGSRASGAARWISPAKALIQLSDRHKREDSFWFSFFHEGGHILNHPKRELFVDGAQVDDDVHEEEANRFAANLLIPASETQKLRTLDTSDDVRRFADRIGVAPGIVVGRLHNDKLWPWNKGNEMIRKIQIVDSE